MDKVKICFVSEDATMVEVSEQIMFVPLSTTKENCANIFKHVAPKPLEDQRYVFLIDNKYPLIHSLGQIIDEHEISVESIVKIYVYPEIQDPQLKEEHLFPDWIRSISAVPDGYALGCYDNLLRIKTLDCDLICAGHKAVINTIKCLDDGTIVTGSSDSSIGFFKNGKLDWTLPTSSAVQKLCLVNNRIIAAQFNGTISMHSLQRISKKNHKTYQPLVSSSIHKDCISSLFPFNSLLVSASHDQSVKSLDPSSLTTLSSLSVPTGVTCGAPLDDSVCLTGHADGSIRLMSSNLTLIDVLKWQKSWVSDIVASPDGHRFATADHKGDVCIFDARMLAKPCWSCSCSGKVLALAWSGNNHLFVGGEECIVREFIV